MQITNNYSADKRCKTCFGSKIDNAVMKEINQGLKYISNNPQKLDKFIKAEGLTKKMGNAKIFQEKYNKVCDILANNLSEFMSDGEKMTLTFKDKKLKLNNHSIATASDNLQILKTLINFDKKIQDFYKGSLTRNHLY